MYQVSWTLAIDPRKTLSIIAEREIAAYIFNLLLLDNRIDGTRAVRPVIREVEDQDITLPASSATPRHD